MEKNLKTHTHTLSLCCIPETNTVNQLAPIKKEEVQRVKNEAEFPRWWPISSPFFFHFIFSMLPTASSPSSPLSSLFFDLLERGIPLLFSMLWRDIYGSHFDKASFRSPKNRWPSHSISFSSNPWKNDSDHQLGGSMIKTRALLYMLLVRGLNKEANALPALLNIQLSCSPVPHSLGTRPVFAAPSVGRV